MIDVHPGLLMASGGALLLAAVAGHHITITRMARRGIAIDASTHGRIILAMVFGIVGGIAFAVTGPMIAILPVMISWVLFPRAPEAKGRATLGTIILMAMWVASVVEIVRLVRGR